MLTPLITTVLSTFTIPKKNHDVYFYVQPFQNKTKLINTNAIDYILLCRPY